MSGCVHQERAPDAFKVISPVKSQNINELTLHQDQCWSSQGLKNFALMKRDYSLKNKVLHSPAVSPVFYTFFCFCLSPHAPNISETHTHISILCTLTNETSLQVAQLFFCFFLHIYALYLPTLRLNCCKFEALLEERCLITILFTSFSLRLWSICSQVIHINHNRFKLGTGVKVMRQKKCSYSV